MSPFRRSLAFEPQLHAATACVTGFVSPYFEGVRAALQAACLLD